MKLLRNNRVENLRAADLRAEILKVDRAGLERRVAEIEQARRQLLLSGTDEQLHANKRDLDAANLQVERAETLVDEFTRLATEAEAREAEEADAAAYEAALAAKKVLDKALAAAETAVAQGRAHLDEATAAAWVLVTWNRKVDPAAQPDRRIPHTAPDIARSRLMSRLIGVR